jgi:hypothetical protein
MNNDRTNPISLKIRGLDRVHVLLWSFRQGCFHFETLTETLNSNLSAYAENRAHQDYIVVGVAADQQTLNRLRIRLIEEYGQHAVPTRTGESSVAA